MVSFSNLDLFIIILFFAIVVFLGFIPKMKEKNNADSYLLSNRNVGMFLFVLTNVATWYGGILGVGEFTFNYGILSWVTQGLPYYIFAIIFAFLFAGKIRKASLFTIPDKLEEIYGRKVGLLSSLLVFILVSPAPYLLMIASLINLIFGIDILPSLFIGIFVSVIYLFKGGYRANIFTDAFQFFVMFIGFIAIVYFASTTLGGFKFLEINLPATHLSVSGGASTTFMIVWFLIALWTFADPGFHQRCYSAKNESVAKYGIIISVFFWMIFDFLTTTTGLYARALLPNMENAVLSFPLLAENILGSGFKGLFYAALFATILSTLNSFLFLSATTFGRDFVFKLKREVNDNNLVKYTRIGLVVSSLISILLAYQFSSVVQIWYLIGSVVIPGIVLLIISAYVEKLKISSFYAITESILAISSSIIWLLIRPFFTKYLIISEIEPMIIGMLVAVVVHIIGMSKSAKL
ncbi:MAG: sodium:solute symporter family protein [Bacteroidetes bacterium]|nr:sodium:solute symporter family protein [Bacteroidota bacterium]MBU1116119.1 sodium:solute symporter family protein [Bacteroidota bacterium]MBU1800411.1 sodium:solute symporter family protein [Bacteroidota bacterium]